MHGFRRIEILWEVGGGGGLKKKKKRWRPNAICEVLSSSAENMRVTG